MASGARTLGKRILILESQDGLRRMVSCALHEAGYATYPAATCDQVRWLLVHNHFDVFLCHEGRNHCADLVREYVAALQVAGTRVIMISDAAEYRGLCETSGIDIYLESPVAVPAFVTLVNGLMNQCCPQPA
jgi:DNA-binding response OmpR family regulator